MTSMKFTEAELEAALARDVRQCVVIGSRPVSGRCLKGFDVFAVDEERPSDLPATFVPTQFESEGLATALEKSRFDKLKSALVVWLGGAGYRTVDAAISSLGYIASLPKGSGVVLDYTVERSSLRALAHTALDALASRMGSGSGGVKYLIQPQAVSVMLRGIGFNHVVDFALPEGGAHLVSAVV